MNNDLIPKPNEPVEKIIFRKFKDVPVKEDGYYRTEEKCEVIDYTWNSGDHIHNWEKFLKEEKE